jgi:hypothetical protein
LGICEVPYHKILKLIETLLGISHIPCYKQLIMIDIILQASVIIFFIGGMLWVLDDDYLPEVRILQHTFKKNYGM